MTSQGHAVTSAPTMSGRLCRWRRKRVPVWRVKRDHVGGYAMDSVHITPAPGFFVGCPTATRDISRRRRSILGSERESDETATFTQLSSPAELRGTDVGHRHPLGHG